ncbi:MAG: glycosyltransferase [Chitinophagaceae bacterium]
MPKHKIAFLIHGLVVGGAEKFFINVVNDYYKAGYDPVVILLSDFNPLRHEFLPGVNSMVITRKSKYDFSVSSRIKKTLEENKIEKVFVVGTFSFFLMKLSFMFKSKMQFMLSIHSTIPKNFRDFFLNLIYLRFVSNRDKVLFICKAQQDYFGKKYYFKPKQSLIVYNGINTSYFLPTAISPELDAAAKKVRPENNIPVNRKIVTMVARLFAEKGHADAISAIKVLREKLNCDACLMLVGSGDEAYTKILHDHTAAMGMTEYVHFIDHKSDVRPYLCASDVFTLTSHTETFSLAALEAMSSGIPCSLTNIGGAAEMINERTGTLSEARNPESIAKSWYEIIQRDYDPVWLHEFVKTNFSLPKMLSEYKEIILEEKQPDPEQKKAVAALTN